MNQQQPTCSNDELLKTFTDSKARYGSDLGLMFMGLHCTLERRIAELERAVAELEQRKRR